MQLILTLVRVFFLQTTVSLFSGPARHISMCHHPSHRVPLRRQAKMHTGLMLSDFDPGDKCTSPAWNQVSPVFAWTQPQRQRSWVFARWWETPTDRDKRWRVRDRRAGRTFSFSQAWLGSTIRAGVTYSGPPGTCAGCPGRWSCWRCRDTGRHTWTGCFSGWERRPVRGCAPRCFDPGSTTKEGGRILFSFVKPHVLRNKTAVIAACLWEFSLCLSKN